MASTGQGYRTISSNRSPRPVHGSPAANQRLAKYVRNGSTEQLHRSEWRFYHRQFCGVAFADRHAKPSQTVEPITAETKRRLLSPLFLRAIQQNSEYQTRKGIGKILSLSFDALLKIRIGANKVDRHFGRTSGRSTTTSL